MPAAAIVLSALLSGSPPRPVEVPFDPAAPEALRALAHVAAGEPGVAEVQEAAARRAEEGTVDPASIPSRGRLAALLPRVTAEVRHDEQSARTAGLQSSGEVDYVRFAPGTAIQVRVAWDLGGLVAPRGELAALAAAAQRVRRRDEAVRRATALYFERRRLRLALLLDPPPAALARAEAEIEIDRLTADLDALTGGIYRGGNP
jgi:hypothetical protein